MVFGGTPFATGAPFDISILTANTEGSSATTDIGEKLEKLKAVYHKIVTHGTFLPDSVLEPSVEDLLRRLLALHPSVCNGTSSFVIFL